MEKSNLLSVGILFGIWFAVFIMLAVKVINKTDEEAKKIHILDADLEWWQSVRNCFR